MRSQYLGGVALLICLTGGAAGITRESITASGEAPTGYDTLTIEKSQAEHTADLEAFDDVERIVPEGLGPVYNAQSCRECHQNPVSGSGSQVVEQRAGHINDQGKFENPTVQIAGPAIVGRNLINDRAITPAAQEFVPPEDTIRTNRLALSILGDGFVEAVDDQTLLNIRRDQCEKFKADSICGMAVFVPIVEVGPKEKRVGRFGWKDQHASLLSFAADAYLNEMGITNRLQPKEVTEVGNPQSGITEPNNLPDPKDGLEDIDRFARFMRATKAPKRDSSENAETVRHGRDLFEDIGCNKCHVENMQTLPKGTPINGGKFIVTEGLDAKTIHPHSDFLLHDIGTGDGVPIAPGEHYGPYLTKELNSIVAVQRHLSPARLVDPLALTPIDSALPRTSVKTVTKHVRVRTYAEEYCGAVALYKAEPNADASDFFRDMQCTANRIRTAPLWGLHERTRFMHDGQSKTLSDAISRHKVEAAKVVRKFKALKSDTLAILTFLRSL